MGNASLVSLVAKQLVTDNLIVTKTDGNLTKHSAQAVGAAATSLAIVMKGDIKDRRKMYFYIRRLALHQWALAEQAAGGPDAAVA